MHCHSTQNENTRLAKGQNAIIRERGISHSQLELRSEAVKSVFVSTTTAPVAPLSCSRFSGWHERAGVSDPQVRRSDDAHNAPAHATSFESIPRADAAGDREHVHNLSLLKWFPWQRTFGNKGYRPQLLRRSATVNQNYFLC